MENRTIFQKRGGNIAGFNAKILKDKEEKKKLRYWIVKCRGESCTFNIQVPRDDSVLEIPENKLHIVCIIDELHLYVAAMWKLVSQD